MLTITTLPNEINEQVIKQIVQLEMDLSKYCLLSVIKQTEADSSKKASLQEQFAALRTQYISELSGVNGDLIWRRDIEPHFLKVLNLHFVDENAASTQKIPLPHAFLTLEACFIELLKNSMDAMIDAYISGSSTNTQLKIEIGCTVAEQNITTVISDNAGGFPQVYLSKIKNDLVEKNYLKETTSSCKEGNKTSFGGAGMGVAQFCALFLDGITFNSSGKREKKFNIPANATSITMQNTYRLGKLGAEISFICPHESFEEIITPKKINKTEDNQQANEPLVLSKPPNKFSKKAAIRQGRASAPDLPNSRIPDIDDSRATSCPGMLTDVDLSKNETSPDSVLRNTQAIKRTPLGLFFNTITASTETSKDFREIRSSTPNSKSCDSETSETPKTIDLKLEDAQILNDVFSTTDNPNMFF